MEQASFSTFRPTARPAGEDLTPRAAFDPRVTPIYVGLGLGWAALLIFMPIAGLSLDPGLTLAFLLVCGLVASAAACLRLRGFNKVATAIESWALLSVASLTGILGTYVVARYPAPVTDAWMVSADRWIVPGLPWRDMVFTLCRHPLLLEAANRAYGSLEWQASLLILLCCATGHADRCSAFVLRWLIALALVVAIFMWFPCNGPNAAYRIVHSDVPAIRSNAGWCAPPILAWLRSAGPLRLDPSALDGIVTFPSFHAAAATLFAWGFWSIRWMRWPMLALNLAMIAATAPIGGRYYADVLAGVAIAGASIKLPAWSLRLRESFRAGETTGLDRDPGLA